MVDKRQGIQSIEVGFRLLEGLADLQGPQLLGDLAAAAGMSASKAHRYLVSFVRAGIVHQDLTSGRYDLGAAALRIGLAALYRHNAVRFATEAAIDLNLELDKSILLSVWGESGPTVVGMYDSTTEFITSNIRVGTVLPLLRSATGLVFLAYLPRKITARVAQSGLRVAQNHSTARIHTKDDIDREIGLVRSRRCASIDEGNIFGVSAAAAPIFDHQGHIAATLSVFGIAGTIEKNGTASPANKLLQCSDAVSRRLGCHRLEPGASHAEWLDKKREQKRSKSETVNFEPPALQNFRQSGGRNGVTSR